MHYEEMRFPNSEGNSEKGMTNVLEVNGGKWVKQFLGARERTKQVKVNQSIYFFDNCCSFSRSIQIRGAEKVIRICIILAFLQMGRCEKKLENDIRRTRIFQISSPLPLSLFSFSYFHYRSVWEM